MALKISFESDIKGFERVQKALEAQSKALNDNADAAERLVKAQSGATGSTGAEIGKGVYSVKSFNEELKNLTSSLDLLNSKRTGFSGFLSLFGEFGKEIRALNTDASINIFKTMGTHIDTLKNNMRGTSEVIKTLRQEIDEATAAGKGELAAKKTTELNELTTRQQLDADMLTKLERSRIYRQSFGGFGGGDGPGGTGGFLGGTSIQGLVGLGGNLIAAAKAMELAASTTLKWQESGLRGEEMLFARQTAIAQGAMGGNVGRQLMTSMGIGQEGGFMAGGAWTDAEGNFDLMQSLRGMRVGFAKMWSPTKSFDQLRAEEAERIRGLDASAQFGIDMAATTYKGWITDPRFSALERQHGKSSQRVQEYIYGMAARGIDADDSIAGMMSLSDLGIAGDVLGGMRADYDVTEGRRRLSALRRQEAELEESIGTRGSSSRITPAQRQQMIRLEETRAEIEAQRERVSQMASAAAGQIDGTFADISLLNRRPEDLGMDQRGQQIYQRQVAYGVNAGRTIQEANDAYLRDLANFRASAGIVPGETPEAVTRMAMSFVQSMQDQIGPGMTVAAQSASGGLRSALAGMEGPSMMTDLDRMTLASQAQKRLQDDLATPGSMMEMGASHILQRAGITNFAQQKYLTDLMTVDPEKAYRIIAQAGGRMSVDEVQAEMDSLTESSRRLQRDVLGYTSEFESILESEGAPDMQLHFRGIRGDVTAGRGYRQARLTSEMTGVGDSPFIADEETSAQDLRATQAMSITKEISDLNRTLTEALGRDISDVLKNEIGGGLVRMGEQISNSVGKLSGQMSERTGNNEIIMPEARQVEGGNEEQDRRLSDPAPREGATERARDVLQRSGFRYGGR